jgi:methionyl-tRNA synthetase
VWFDAVIGYLSASIEWARRFGDGGRPDPDAWQRWWHGGDGQARAYYFMGKDNITFHSQIWPAELLAYDGRGVHGGTGGTFGALNLPTEVVSSEFLTMSGSKFSTSRRTVIYVGDFLREFGADSLRYFIAVAGPENQDADFTWEEFVRRNNFELANEWGNLVNRSVSMAHKNFGAIPAPKSPTDADAELLRASEAAFATVGDLLSRSRFKAAATEAMRVVGLANKYISESEPWKLKDDLERQGTVLHTALQVVDDAKTLLTPFLPHSSQAVFEALGGRGVWAAQPEIRTVTDFDDDVEGVGVPDVVDYPVLTGEYASEQATWARRDIEVGRPLSKPTPLFAKLDAKLGETGPPWAPIA